MAKYYKGCVLIAVAGTLLSGCSTIGKSTAAGAGVGGLVGGVTGSFLPGDESSKPKNILVGAVAGGAVGALSGALIHKSMEDKERDAFEKGKSEGAKTSKGSLASASSRSTSGRYIPPKIERRWVDDEVRGNILVEGHYEQVIVEEGHWE